MEERRLITWEHRDEGARLLMVTNMWPDNQRPTYGIFVQAAVEAVRQQGIPCDVLYIRGYSGLRAYLAGALACLLLPLAHRGKYLLVHSHGGETALAARMFFGPTVMATYMGTDLLGAQVGGPAWLRAKCWARSHVLRCHASLMSATTTKSKEMAELLTFGARSRNLIIADGIDRSLFRPRDHNEARRALGWPADAAVVLFAGRADAPEKRLWLAEQAVAQAKAARPDVELRIASQVPQPELPIYYAAADCLIHTSRSEGSPNVVKEALACNLPIVATSAGDVQELIAGVRACRLCPPDPGALSGALLETLKRGERSNGWDLTERLEASRVAGQTVAWYATNGASREMLTS